MLHILVINEIQIFQGCNLNIYLKLKKKNEKRSNLFEQIICLFSLFILLDVYLSPMLNSIIKYSYFYILLDTLK